MNKFLLLIFILISTKNFSQNQNRITLIVNKNRYDSIANIFILNKGFDKNLNYFSIPVFSLKENRKNFDCDNNFVEIINFKQFYSNQIIVVYKNRKIIKTFILRDSAFAEEDSLWFVNKLKIKSRELKKIIKNRNRGFIFAINDDAVSGFWIIKNHSLYHIKVNLFGIKYIEATTWIFQNIDINFLRNPVVYYAKPSLFLKIKSKFFKKKQQCKNQEVKDSKIINLVLK